MANFLEQNTSHRTTSLVSTIALLLLLPLFVIGVTQTIQLLLRAAGTSADIIVRTDIELEPINTQFMHAFAQGGEEQKDMLAPIIPEIRALRPKVIRIDHIYDYYNVVTRSSGSLSFDFSRLDKAIDSIRATGATPLLSLSYMPQAIAKGGNIINPPENWNEWSIVIQKTIEWYSGKNNRNFSNMYYEVWNEPDLATFGGWKLTGEKNYVTLYNQAAVGAKNAKDTNRFFFGGPATTGLYKTWILAIVASGSRFDFLSWHSYLEDPHQFTKDQQNIAEWLTPYPFAALTPKLITESGFTGNKDGRYNTTYASAHTAAVFRELSTGGPTYLFSFELKDGPNQEKGWGLIGHESLGKKLKPRYSMYSFLDAMTGKRLEISGEGSWTKALATKQENTFKVLLVNFNNQASKSENVPVTFTKLSNASYTLRERVFLGRDIKVTVAASESAVRREIFMPANSVAILELTPIATEPATLQ